MKPKNVISASQQVIAIRPGTKLFFGKSGVFSTMPEYEGEGPMLYADYVEKAEPIEEIVQF